MRGCFNIGDVRMNDKQEPLIVYCFRDDDLGALVLVGRDPFGMIGAGDCIDNADMPEPDVAGLWAWEDDGSEPAYAGIDFLQWEDERLHVGESLVEWRGHWRRPTEAEMRHFTTGQRVLDSKPNVTTLEVVTASQPSRQTDVVFVPTPVEGPVRG